MRPFIHMYFRQTILSGSNPIKIFLSRGDIFGLEILFFWRLDKKMY